MRSGSELLDRLIKEIIIASPHFELDYLMVLIRERIYTVNSANRRFIVSWLHAVLIVPAFSIREYISEVVDGVFKALEDPAPAVREATVSVLSELLHKLDPRLEGHGLKDDGKEVNIAGIVNVLVPYANSPLTVQKELAIRWLNQVCLEMVLSVTSIS